MLRTLQSLLLFFLLYQVYSKAVRSNAETVCKVGAVDLVFVIDQSGSVGLPDYKLGLEAASELTDALKVGNSADQSKVGVVLFDSDASVAFGLDAYSTNDALRNAINSLSYSGGGGTDIAKGMDAAIKQVFRNDPSRTVPRVMIIVTDGNDSSDVKAEHSQAVEKKIRTYALGVGPEVDMDELEKATGSKSLVYTATDYSSLSSVMNQICKDIENNVSPPTARLPASCGCEDSAELNRVWLDIVFVLDTSDTCYEDDLATTKGFLYTIASGYNIGPKSVTGDMRYSRVAIINAGAEAKLIANFSKYNTGKDLRRDAQMIQRLGGIHNLDNATQLAQQLVDEDNRSKDRRNVRKVVVLFTSSDIKCSDQGHVKASVDKIKANEPQTNKETCRLLAAMMADRVAVMIIAVKVAGGDFPNIDVDTCYKYRNDDTYLDEFSKGLCMANCYCLDPYTQFAQNECNKAAECVAVQELALPYGSSADVCADEGGYVTEVLTKEKEEFMNGLHSQAGFFPYWLGMRKNGNSYVYADGVPVGKGDYSNWCTEKGQSETSGAEGKDCIYVNTCKGFRTGWFHEKCAVLTPAHFFSCQKPSCTMTNYCDLS